MIFRTGQKGGFLLRHATFGGFAQLLSEKSGAFGESEKIP
ncbi:hypothetical protein HMPREF0262_01693 [Clostridium sp. ATCC 29733]|nr:hypothetical protein HMPREF0262_01693 [Clostridium sp. ATCC 29733]